MALSILLVSADAFSQVVIRERITVSPRSHAATASMQSPPLVYVARDSGTLAGTISLARKDSALTPGRLSITLHDTTIEIETREYLNTFITWWEELFDVCNEYIVIPYPASYGYSLRAPCILRFFLRDIHAGDTLGFVYHGFYELPVTRVSGDDVTLSIADSPCYVYWEGELQNLEECIVQLAYASPDLGGFLVNAKDDTLGYSDTTSITVTAVDEFLQEVPFEPSSQLSFSLKSPSRGWLVAPDGDTSSTLSGVSYIDARAGKVKFVGSGLLDTLSVIPVEITVEGALSPGTGTVYMRPLKLTFEGADLPSVYPHYRGHNNSTTQRDTLDLVLKSVTGSSVAKFVNVKIGRPTLVDSGGHSHGGGRPLGKYQMFVNSHWTTVDSIEQKTDETGTLRFRFLASEFGGIEKIKAIQVTKRGELNQTINAVKQAWTRVADLARLVAGVNHNLIGGTCEHHGPQSALQTCSSPDNNHFAAAVVIQSIPNIANSWINDLGNREILHINDMSLPYGGRFDKDGNWTGSHHEHRLGMSVDLRTAIPNVRNGVKVRDNSGRTVGNPAFEDLVTQFGVYTFLIENHGTIFEHYHLNYDSEIQP